MSVSVIWPARAYSHPVSPSNTCISIGTSLPDGYDNLSFFRNQNLFAIGAPKYCSRTCLHSSLHSSNVALSGGPCCCNWRPLSACCSIALLHSASRRLGSVCSSSLSKRSLIRWNAINGPTSNPTSARVIHPHRGIGQSATGFPPRISKYVPIAARTPSLMAAHPSRPRDLAYWPIERTLPPYYIGAHTV
jgi:hypothetical protein